MKPGCQRNNAIKPIERNPRFSNPLVHSTSLYLRQHAHNPVFWYPWGREALDRAKLENKPILLSIGYSACYWCHVMEREVFENLSIASLMNRCFINIKVDREEHPQIDDIYMVARQLMTHEGGWPNNVFLTPDLKPFYAGGTYAPDESYTGRPPFPRLLEWLHHAWTTQQSEVLATAESVTKQMQPHLVFKAEEGGQGAGLPEQADGLFALLSEHHDARAGGFFQAPKFPHESYLSFLLAYHEHTGSKEALDIIKKSLGKMAAGGIYDHVGGGFHRYAVDKEWYIPHFEKMLYNQAQLVRVYTDAARLTGSEYFSDIARSILDFVCGPMTDGSGGFYAAIDAETDGIEGAYYAWTAEELQSVLDEKETIFFTHFFALADIPAFPGHKHAQGQVIIARKPLDDAARNEPPMPYVQLAAMAGQMMNKLLAARNLRKAPNLDDKIITSWNGLMIDAFAHAGQVFYRPDYIARARKAADFLLEHAIDNDGKLMRIYAGGRARIEATLEDYAFLIKGLITLMRAENNHVLLEPITSLITRCDELFADTNAPGYYATAHSPYFLVRIKSGDDSAIPNANAVMLHNFADLYEITEAAAWRDKGLAMAEYFLGGKARVLAESACMLEAAMRLGALVHKKASGAPATFVPLMQPVATEKPVTVSAELFPRDAKKGGDCELQVTLEIKDGWHINPGQVLEPELIPTQLDVQGEGVNIIGITYPPGSDGAPPVYAGNVTLTARLSLTPLGKKHRKIKVSVRFQPCQGTTCQPAVDVVVTI